jgi:hypothetical protein
MSEAEALDKVPQLIPIYCIACRFELARMKRLETITTSLKEGGGVNSEPVYKIYYFCNNKKCRLFAGDYL